MDSLENLLFLACFTIVPLAMIALLAYAFVRWLRDRRAIAELRAEGWTPIGTHDPALRDALADLHLDGRRVRLFDRARLDEAGETLLFVTRQIRSRGGSSSRAGGSTIRLAIAPRRASGPVGVISRREGGLVEAAVLGIAGALGASPIEPQGWQWAVVSGPSPIDAWTPEAGAALEEHVRPGERLYLGSRHVAIAAPAHRLRSELMREARARLDAIRAAVVRGA